MTESQILDKRRAIYAEQQDLGKRIQTEQRGLNTEERAQFDAAEAEYSDLTDQLRILRSVKDKKAEQAEKEYRQKEGGRAPADDLPPGNEGGKPDYRSVFNKIQRYGRGALNADEAQVAREYRAQTKGTGSAGGFIVPEFWDGELITKMKAYGGLMGAASIDRSDRGGVLYYPIVDDLANEGEWVAEAAAISSQDIPFAQVAMNDYKLTSQIVLVSLELAQDETYGLESVLTEAFARRMGVTAGKALVNGDGTGKPTGLLQSAASSITAAGTDGVTRAELIRLKHSVDPSYRAGGLGQFIFNNNTLAELKILTVGSGDDRPLWQPGMIVSEPDRLDGSTYVIDQEMPDLGAGNNSIAFGDLSKYKIRIVRDISAFTFLEKYMNQGAIGYMSYMRLDGKLLDTNGVKKLTNAAS